LDSHIGKSGFKVSLDVHYNLNVCVPFLDQNALSLLFNSLQRAGFLICRPLLRKSAPNLFDPPSPPPSLPSPRPRDNARRSAKGAGRSAGTGRLTSGRRWPTSMPPLLCRCRLRRPAATDPQVAAVVRLTTWAGLSVGAVDVINLRLVLMGCPASPAWCSCSALHWRSRRHGRRNKERPRNKGDLRGRWFGHLEDACGRCVGV
jgi:hypothetical protein